MKKAIIVGVAKSEDEATNSLNELNNLLETIGIKEVYRIYQKADRFNNKTYVGQGKLEEILVYVKEFDVDYVVFDDELSPAQIYNLDEAIPCSVLDRAYVILEIFRLHASTPLAKLEVELANLNYLYPRLKTFHEGFDRQGGGIGSKGSGETQLELDKRQLASKILQVKNKIDEIKRRKINEVNKRSDQDILTVALVGYTNACKSSTMNSLLSYLNKYEYKNNLKEKSVEAENKLFKTLSTSVRKLTYKNVSFLLSDTIGFINKIPAELINSFLTTLLEVKNADLIIIVLDASSKTVDDEFMTTIRTLDYIGSNNPNVLLLLNKVDKLSEYNKNVQIPKFDTMLYSNKDEKYQERLLEYIFKFITKDYELMDLKVPYSDPKIINQIETYTNVISKTYMPEYVLYKINAPKHISRLLSLYKDEPDNIVS
jgi:GTP-binding protein HflX